MVKRKNAFESVETRRQSPDAMSTVYGYQIRSRDLWVENDVVHVNRHYSTNEKLSTRQIDLSQCYLPPNRICVDVTVFKDRPDFARIVVAIIDIYLIRNTFGISLTLAYRILDFIEQYWEPWVKRHKVPASIHRHRLFLSARGGRPITERAMTQIISAAFRELGFEKGIGPHTLRGKFTSETADDELAERLELGLDTSNRSIAAAIAPKLGHSDPDQFYRYASASQSKRARIEREGRITELKALRLENGELKGENERLRTALAATPSGGERNSRKKTLL